MKTLIALLSLITSFAAFAAQTSSCKADAELAAVEVYTAKYGESMIFTKSKFNPVLKENTITHMIQILDTDRESNEIVTVTLNKFSCKVISID